MSHVYVKIKDEKHAKKVIKRLDRIGYDKIDGLTDTIGEVMAICVFDDGDYQLLNTPNWPDMIKPKELMGSRTVKYFLENKHV